MMLMISLDCEPHGVLALRFIFMPVCGMSWHWSFRGQVSQGSNAYRDGTWAVLITGHFRSTNYATRSNKQTGWVEIQYLRAKHFTVIGAKVVVVFFQGVVTPEVIPKALSIFSNPWACTCILPIFPCRPLWHGAIKHGIGPLSCSHESVPERVIRSSQRVLKWL